MTWRLVTQHFVNLFQVAIATLVHRVAVESCYSPPLVNHQLIHLGPNQCDGVRSSTSKLNEIVGYIGYISVRSGRADDLIINDVGHYSPISRSQGCRVKPPKHNCPPFVK